MDPAGGWASVGAVRRACYRGKRRTRGLGRTYRSPRRRVRPRTVRRPPSPAPHPAMTECTGWPAGSRRVPVRAEAAGQWSRDRASRSRGPGVVPASGVPEPVVPASGVPASVAAPGAGRSVPGVGTGRCSWPMAACMAIIQTSRTWSNWARSRRRGENCSAQPHSARLTAGSTGSGAGLVPWAPGTAPTLLPRYTISALSLLFLICSTGRPGIPQHSGSLQCALRQNSVPIIQASLNGNPAASRASSSSLSRSAHAWPPPAPIGVGVGVSEEGQQRTVGRVVRLQIGHDISCEAGQHVPAGAGARLGRAPRPPATSHCRRPPPA